MPGPAPGTESSAAHLPKGMGSKMRVSSTTLLDEVSLKDRRLGADPASPPAPTGGGLERVGKNLLFSSAQNLRPHEGPKGSVGGSVWSETLDPHADPRAELKVELVKENDFLVPGYKTSYQTYITYSVRIRDNPSKRSLLYSQKRRDHERDRGPN